MGMKSIGWAKELNRHGGMLVEIVMVGFGQMKIVVDGKTISSIRKAQVPNIPILRQLRPSQLKGRQKIVVVGDGSLSLLVGALASRGTQFADLLFVHGQFWAVEQAIVLEYQHVGLLVLVSRWHGFVHLHELSPQFDVAQSASDLASAGFLGHGLLDVAIPLGIDCRIPRLLDQLGQLGFVASDSVHGVVPLHFVAERMPHFLAQRLVQVLLEGLPTVRATLQVDATDASNGVGEDVQLLLLVVKLFLGQVRIVVVVMIVVVASLGRLAAPSVALVVRLGGSGLAVASTSSTSSSAAATASATRAGTVVLVVWLIVGAGAAVVRTAVTTQLSTRCLLLA